MFAAFFVGSLIPLRALIGAPFSFVVLAFFAPKFNKRLIIGLIIVLSCFNIILDLPEWSALFAIGDSYLTSLGIYNASYFVLPTFAVSYMVGRFLIYVTAIKIVKKSRIWERYPIV